MSPSSAGGGFYARVGKRQRPAMVDVFAGDVHRHQPPGADEVRAHEQRVFASDGIGPNRIAERLGPDQIALPVVNLQRRIRRIHDVIAENDGRMQRFVAVMNGLGMDDRCRWRSP